MSGVMRLYRYESLLGAHRAVSAEALMSALEVSQDILKRNIANLRDQHHVLIEYNRELGGYQMGQGHTDRELPRLWFSQDEILTLIAIQHLLKLLEPSLLGSKVKHSKAQLAQLMDKHRLASQDVKQCIRLVHAGKRIVVTKSFELVAAITLRAKRLKIGHFNRQNSISTEHEVSPKRLAQYRDSWYLDGWCHLGDDVRKFGSAVMASYG